MKKLTILHTLNFYSNDNGDFFAIYVGRYFKINATLYLSLKKFQETNSIEETLAFLKNEMKEADLTSNELIEYFKTFQNKLLEKPKQESVVRLFKLVNPERLKNFVQKVASIFPNQTLFYSLFALFFLGNIFLITYFGIIHYDNFWYFIDKLDISYIADYLFFMLILNVLIIIHEIGHAAVAKKFGIETNELGFGIYVTSFVFYVNLTQVWTLDKNKRIYINLAGVYTQLIAGVLIGLLLFFFTSPRIVYFMMFLIVSNFFNVISNLIPYLKTDGYWVYSDYFNINNLRDKSTSFLKEFFINRNFKIVNQTSKSLQFYSFSFVLFILFFAIQMFFIVKWLTENYNKIESYYVYGISIMTIGFLLFSIMRKLTNKFKPKHG